ncbi:hypothetical protein [Povalibacter sp.]|uniref:hypothetical protein n=1 Tax=Povalibacter sp. TaxID=1962978 RepID=UPI002F3F0B68
MTQQVAPPTRTTAAQISAYDDMPFAQVLFRYLWPFWLFKNASTGDRFARSAAYLHNRRMRVYLPGYLLKWSCNCASAFALIMLCGATPTDAPGILSIMAAGAGVLFAGGLTVLFVTGYIYLYLSHNSQ